MVHNNPRTSIFAAWWVRAEPGAGHRALPPGPAGVHGRPFPPTGPCFRTTWASPTKTAGIWAAGAEPGAGHRAFHPGTEVYTQEAFPEQRAMVQNNLVDIYAAAPCANSRVGASRKGSTALEQGADPFRFNSAAWPLDSSRAGFGLPGSASDPGERRLSGHGCSRICPSTFSTSRHRPCIPPFWCRDRTRCCSQFAFPSRKWNAITFPEAPPLSL